MAPSHEHQDPSSISPENDEHDKSPESAAVARGAARTAASSAGKSSATAATRGAIAGRLPAASRTAAKASKTISRAPKIAARSPPRVAPRNIPKVAAQRIPKVPHVRAPRSVPRSSAPKLSARMPKAPRANTIARASDRASKVFDVVDAGLEQNQSPSESLHSQKAADRRAKVTQSITKVLQQAASFGKIFITNTILGIAVFATYEGVIDHIAPSLPIEDTTNDCFVHNNNDMSDGREECEITSEPSSLLDNHILEKESDPMDRATLPQHFFAGALGGASHAILSLAMEVKLNIPTSDTLSSGKGLNVTTFANLIQQQKLAIFKVPSMSYSTSSILHHSLAHSVLFGSYQLTKRTVLQQYLPDSTTTKSGPSGNNDTIRIAAIAVAGGLAGQFQHITSHFSEQWLGLVGNETKISSSNSSLLRRLTLASWPSWRSTMMAFPPSAIGFLAFEYGKLMMAGDEVMMT